MQRYTLKFNFQIKFYFFIENLCFCSLKIAVCVLKITIISKNCRLKITAESKNYYLKIPVSACVCVRVYARAYECGQIAIRTHDKDRHTTSTRPEQDHRNTRPPEKGVKQNKFCDCEKICTRSIKKSQKNL